MVGMCKDGGQTETLREVKDNTIRRHKAQRDKDGRPWPWLLQDFIHGQTLRVTCIWCSPKLTRYDLSCCRGLQVPMSLKLGHKPVPSTTTVGFCELRLLLNDKGQDKSGDRPEKEVSDMSTKK